MLYVDNLVGHSGGSLPYTAFETNLTGLKNIYFPPHCSTLRTTMFFLGGVTFASGFHFLWVSSRVTLSRSFIGSQKTVIVFLTAYIGTPKAELLKWSNFTPFRLVKCLLLNRTERLCSEGRIPIWFRR